MIARTVFFTTLMLMVSGCYLFVQASSVRAEGSLDRRFAVSASSAHQFKADLKAGGAVSVWRHAVAANLSMPTADIWNLSLNLMYDAQDYSFSSIQTAKPWGSVQRVGAGARLTRELSSRWRLNLGPMIQYAGESGAAFEDSLIYGAAVSAAYTASRDLTVGFGASVFYRLAETRALPVFIITWRITENLRFGNPGSRPFASPAGLEFTYTPAENWELGLGGAYHSSRFRLDKNGPVPGGIGQHDGWPLYIHLKRRFSNRFELSLMGGWSVEGRVRIEDRDGRQLRKYHQDAAPIAAIHLGTTF